MGETLAAETVRNRLPEGWTYEDDHIVRTVDFDSYLDGVDFATAVAELADEAFHHPRIVIEFRSVTVEFTSHDVGGVTERDLELAEQVAQL
ncbi:MAG: 4a-hydroxytetrahydrobiopterin dehydratase [Halodesulfurarchaeum sp.]|nr:4a-hydroxytetrahydrobiopterin dehydratase [Halodesulfurarchaeum sp.]